MTWLKGPLPVTHAVPHLDAAGWCRCTAVCCIDSTDGRCKCQACACAAGRDGRCEGEGGTCSRCRPFAFQAAT